MSGKKIATRDGFGEMIVELGKKDSSIYVVDVDIGKSCKTTEFAKQLPTQHVNVGIAEQSAAGVAAGLATTGKTPYVVTYAVFGSLRMCEMIRQEICYPNLNVKIACSHGGLTPRKRRRQPPEHRGHGRIAHPAQHDHRHASRLLRRQKADGGLG